MAAKRRVKKLKKVRAADYVPKPIGMHHGRPVYRVEDIQFLDLPPK